MREAGKVVGHQTQAGKEELRGAWGRHKRDDPAPATIDEPNTFVSGRTCVISALGLSFSSAVLTHPSRLTIS